MGGAAERVLFCECLITFKQAGSIYLYLCVSAMASWEQVGAGKPPFSPASWDDDL